MTQQLITPTGYLVSDAAPQTPEWYAARREGITGTDLPKILGLTQYGNALTVWRDKRGEKVDVAGEEAEWGTRLEPIVADVWAEQESAPVVAVGVLAQIEAPWIRASLDRVVERCPDGDSAPNGCALEIKTRNAYVESKWRDDIPDDTLAQVQWGLVTTGLDHAHIACLIGGQKMRTFRVDRDVELETYLVNAAKPVWQNVVDQVPPDVAADKDGVLLRELNEMFAKRAGAVQVDPDVVRPILWAYKKRTALENLVKARKNVAKTILVQLLGGGDTAEIDGKVVYTYKRPQESSEVTAPNLRRLKAEEPKTYDALVAKGIITTASNNPRINIK